MGVIKNIEDAINNISCAAISTSSVRPLLFRYLEMVREFQELHDLLHSTDPKFPKWENRSEENKCYILCGRIDRQLKKYDEVK